MRRKFSMTYVLLYIVCSITLIGILAIGMNQLVDEKVNKEMNILVNMNMELTSFKKNLSNNNLYLTSYFNSGNNEYYIKYNENKKEINRIIEEISKDINLNETSSMYYRILLNLLEYEERLSSQLLRTQSVDAKSYELQQNIKKIYSYLEQQANYFTESCIEYQTQNYEIVNISYNKLQNAVFMVLVIIILINYVYIAGLITGIVSNLNNFRKAATKLAEEEWYIEDIKEQQCLELNLFALAFNNMKNNIQEYISQLNLKAQLEKDLIEQKLKNTEMDQLLKESQLLSLQSQMNPHFLFNTLNIISRTAMFEGSDTVVSLMESMSKILRYNLSNIRNMVALREELDIVRAYLYIQTTRFQDRMNFSIDTGNIDLDNVCIPPMIIQPVVENCIKHGLKNTEKDGEVIIQGVQVENNIIVTVKDNGEGIKEEQLNNIFKEKSKKDTTKYEIGLKNVKNRLDLTFGEGNWIDIKSTHGNGTSVIITIPMRGRCQDD